MSYRLSTTVPPTRAAVLVVSVLTADALLHLYWATGATWPAADEGSLSRAVLGRDVPFTPPVLLPLVALLLAAAALVGAHSRRPGHRVLRLCTLAVAAGLCCAPSRGSTGCSPRRPAPPSTGSTLCSTPPCAPSWHAPPCAWRGGRTRPVPVERPDDLTARLVRAAQRGDTLAMAELLDLLAPYVGRVCAPIALDQGADAAQEALVAVFRSLRTLKDPAALHGWVRTIAVREAVRTAHRSARTVPADLSALPARGDPQLSADIRDVLDRLSPEHRAVLMLRDVEGLDERTAAALLGVRTGTVKSRLHRARDTFRKAWTS